MGRANPQQRSATRKQLEQQYHSVARDIVKLRNAIDATTGEEASLMDI
jgi:hypothetical protein